MNSELSLESNDWVDLVDRVCDLVNKESGNVLGSKQKTMVENRLRNRMLDKGLNDPRKYRFFLESNIEEELKYLVSLITTHHTFFFREFLHFDFLKENLKKIAANVREDGRTTINIWSAACSRGHEVHSLAMFFNHHLKSIAPDLTFRILGSDIDPLSIKIAQNGVYHYNEIKSIPMIYQEGNWQRGSGTIADFVKVKKSLTDYCDYSAINLIKEDEWPTESFDIIFCRNVFIYFAADIVEKLANSFIKKLKPKGYFFSGISESLAHYNVKSASLGTSIYMDSKYEILSNIKEDTRKTHKDLIRIMCVDDSPSMLKLYSKILTPENGFEIVAVAENGKVAGDLLKTTKIDAVTLDIHMPVMTGIEYLEKFYSSSHPPVIMISSVSRSDSSLARKAIDLGVSDFIEKPELRNMNQVGDEIRTKLKVAHLEKKHKFKNIVDSQFMANYEIEDFDNKIQYLMNSFRDVDKIEKFLRDFKNGVPATFMLFNGPKELIEEYIKKIQSITDIKVNQFFDQKIDKNNIYVIHHSEYFNSYSFHFEDHEKVFLIFGRMTSSQTSNLNSIKNKDVILEDLNDNLSTELEKNLSEIVPVSSFAYLVKKRFSK